MDRPYPVEKVVHVDRPYPVEKVVHVDRPYPVEKVVEVDRPVEKIVEKIIDRPYPVEKIVDRPYPVEKIVDRPYPVEKIVHVDRPVQVPVEVKVPVYIPQPYPQPYPVHVEKKVPVHVPYEKKVVYPVYHEKHHLLKPIHKSMKSKVDLESTVNANASLYSLANIKTNLFAQQHKIKHVYLDYPMPPPHSHYSYPSIGHHSVPIKVEKHISVEKPKFSGYHYEKPSIQLNIDHLMAEKPIYAGLFFF